MGTGKAAAGVFLVWACASMAGAAPATEAARLEKRQAAENRKARELASKAANAAARVSDLSANLAGIGGAKAATDAARADASAQLAEVQGEAETHASDLAAARDRLETLLIRFLQDEPAVKAGLIGKSGTGATVASFFTSALADQVVDKRVRIAEAEAAIVEIASRREELDGRSAALARQGAQTAEEIASAARERDQLQAEADRSGNVLPPSAV
ncbi:MAG: hypothetical protein WDN76_01335 [Alphaproteobacteria bacterium]